MPRKTLRQPSNTCVAQRPISVPHPRTPGSGPARSQFPTAPNFSLFSTCNLTPLLQGWRVIEPRSWAVSPGYYDFGPLARRAASSGRRCPKCIISIWIIKVTDWSAQELPGGTPDKAGETPTLPRTLRSPKPAVMLNLRVGIIPCAFEIRSMRRRLLLRWRKRRKSGFRPAERARPSRPNGTRHLGNSTKDHGRNHPSS